MDTFEAIQSRRAVKQFDPEHNLNPNETRRLLEAAMLSPTAFNMQNWRFVVVTNPGLRQDLRVVGFDQAQITDASLMVYVVMDKTAFSDRPERYWRDADPVVGEIMVNMMGGFYSGNESLIRDEGHRSCGIAAQSLMLAARSMGYDSCPMTGFDFEKTGELLNLPGTHEISMAVAIGKALSPAHARPGQLPYQEVVIQDRFSE